MRIKWKQHGQMSSNKTGTEKHPFLFCAVLKATGTKYEPGIVTQNFLQICRLSDVTVLTTSALDTQWNLGLGKKLGEKRCPDLCQSMER